RNAPHETTGFTPAELVYGQNVRSPLHLVKGNWVEPNVHPSVLEYVLDLLQRFKYSREIADLNYKEAQAKSKARYDLKATERKFKDGDLVLLLRPSRSNKLEVQWAGPHKVVKRLSDTNYLVDKSNSKKSPVLYHVNLLKP